jgi:hypothetical protein
VIRNIETDEIRKHLEYSSAYSVLVDGIRTHLEYRSIQRFSDGHEEESDDVLMTAAVVREYENGLRLIRRPGSQVLKK